MIKNSQKEYCANNIASYIITQLRIKYPTIRDSKLISDFMMSNTYDMLYNFKTYFWAESYDYVLEEYLNECSYKKKK